MASVERENFARNLRKIIESRHLTTAHIAADLGVSRGTMSDYLYCRAYPRPAKMTQLCKILGVSISDLTAGAGQGRGEEESQPDPELLKLAKEIRDNPDARTIYSLIKGRNSAELRRLKTLIELIDENKK